MRSLLAALALTSALVATGCSLPEEVTDAAGGGGSGAGGSEEKSCEGCTGQQEQAFGAAQSYLDLSGFSRSGLIRQLSSDAGDGYAKKDATVAVDKLAPNYNQQAVRSARDYLDISNFSRDGLIQQLSSSAGDGYTKDQAIFAADKVLK